MAAHLEPEILIVDEVLSVGDAEFQKKCVGKMQDAASRQGRTILFVSHNMAAVESLCDSALLLVNGRCAALGPTAKVVPEYLHDMNRASAVPLAMQRDRSGSGDFRFVSFSLEGPQGQKASAFQCGSAAFFHLVVENRTKSDLRNVRISLGIDNEMGHRIAVLDTALVGDDLVAVPPGAANVRIALPKVMLNPGRYRLTFYAAVRGIIADWIKNAAMFDVEAGDYYGTGQLPGHGQGMFLIDHRFTMDQAGSKLEDQTSVAL